MNFVEVMALYRAFTAGRFKCSDMLVAVSVAGYRGEGYALVIRKASARKFCLQCIRDIVAKRPLRLTENTKYLTIQ